MPSYAWEGRTRTGGVVRGEIRAASKEEAVARVKSSGILVQSVRETSVSGAVEPVQVPVGDPGAQAPSGARVRGLRDKAFHLGVVAVFTAAALGVAYVAPVMSYDCRRDEAGVVDCVVHRRMYGLVPLEDV